MNSTTDIRHGDLWTETIRRLGIRASGKHSPFRALGSREDAVNMVWECSIALLLVGLVQLSLSWLAGVGSAVDALVYMPLAGLLYRFNSRIAAVLLLAFSLSAVAVVVVGSLLGIEARTDLILIGTLLWASVRAVEATAVVSRQTVATGSAHAGGEALESRRRFSRAAWLTLAAIAFVIAALPRFVPLFPDRLGSLASIVPVAPPVAPEKPVEETARIDDGRLVFSAPNGFVEPRTEEPGIGNIAESFVPPAMRLDALFVTPADVDVFRRDHQFEPSRYVMIQTVREQSDRRLSSEEFLAVKRGQNGVDAEHLERLIGADAELSRWLGAVARNGGARVEMDGAQVRSEGVVADTERSVSFAAVVEVPAASGAAGSSQIVVTSLVLARGKILVVYTYAPYAKPDDVVAAKEVARNVVQNVTNENPA